MWDVGEDVVCWSLSEIGGEKRFRQIQTEDEDERK